MSFFVLVLHNVRIKPVRSVLTAAAVAMGVGAAITIGIVTHSLRETAIQVLQVGQADFTISQEGVTDLLDSAIDEQELALLRETTGVAAVTGVLVRPVELDAENPFFLRIGIDPAQLEEFGVRVVEGRAFTATADDEIMLGYRAAANLDRAVGDELLVGDDRYRVVGLFATGEAFGDSASMLPLVELQAQQRRPGAVTLAFARTEADVDVDGVREVIEDEFPQLVTVRTAEEFGRADRNLALLTAADDAATIVALVFGVVIVTNTMLLTFTERMREFGILRSIGWSRRRMVAMVMTAEMTDRQRTCRVTTQRTRMVSSLQSASGSTVPTAGDRRIGSFRASSLIVTLSPWRRSRTTPMNPAEHRRLRGLLQRCPT